MSPNAAQPPGKTMASLMDPALVRTARHVYRSFFEAHPNETQRPLGVTIDRHTFRGNMVFGRRPVLLPRECFVPLEQIQAEPY